MRRTKAVFATGLFIMAGLGVGALMSATLHRLARDAGIPVPPEASWEEPLIDAADPFIVEAYLTATLTQWGTDTPYTGTGPPGIRLGVETEGDVLEWTLVAWANETTPPPLVLCAQSGLYYDQNDWLYRSDRNDSVEQGNFITTPSTVPARLGTGGDQCHLRLQATGPWRVLVCIENGGLPKGIYRDGGGRLHYDDFDRCLETIVQV